MDGGHELGGEDYRRVFLGRYLGHGLERAQLERDRMRAHDVGGVGQLLRRLKFALGGDDFGAALALGFGFFRHSALHVVGEDDVLDLDRRHLRAPRFGVLVDDVLDLLIDARRIGKKLVEAEPADDVSHRGLADLIDRIVDILNHDHRFFRIGNMIVSDRRDVDRDVILRDDFLRGVCIVTVRKDTRTIC